MKKKITVLPGDGIGPEIIKQAYKVLNAIEKKFGHSFECQEGLIGGIAIYKEANSLPKKTIELCLNSDAILFGTIGTPHYDNDFYGDRPEQGLLKLRKEMELYCNIRPIIVYPSLFKYSPLKNSKIQNIDFVIYRELTGGIYFGEKGRSHNKKNAYDYCRYSTIEIERIGIKAFEAALKRKKKLTLIDKSNVLETSKLWRETIMKLSENYKSVNVNYLFVDNAAMQLILNPIQFDVILTENMFGDILSDEASVISGSIGLLPSASLGNKTPIFEPIHGSYHQVKGKNIANPIGCILSVSMMLDYFNLYQESEKIKNAVQYSIKKKFCTIDINSINPKNTELVGDFLAKYIIDN